MDRSLSSARAHFLRERACVFDFFRYSVKEMPHAIIHNTSPMGKTNKRAMRRRFRNLTPASIVDDEPLRVIKKCSSANSQLYFTKRSDT